MSASDSHQTAYGGQINGLRHLSYTTNSHVEQHSVRDLDGEIDLRFLVRAENNGTIRLDVHAKGTEIGRLPPLASILEAAEHRWHRWFDRVPKLTGRLESHYYYAWWVVANNLVSPLGQVRYESMMPSKSQYIGIWNWDAAFHALAVRHADPELARDQLRTVLDHQLADGMLPDVVFDEGIVASINHPIPGPVTKPPVFAWAALKLHEIDPNSAFLKEIYEPLTRWNAWWLERNLDPLRGLPYYKHPYSSGLDDSPVWDHGFPVVSPDLSTYLSVQMEALSRMAAELGLPEQANSWRFKAHELIKRMQLELYDPVIGNFAAYSGSYRIPEITLANYYPLWTGRLSNDIQRTLLAQLTDPDLFWQHFPLSTVARTSPGYDRETMWRGPTWINCNYIFVEALSVVGREDLANALRQRTLTRLTEQPGLHEFYNPETGKPASSAATMFGWTATLFIDLALQTWRER
jgi:glycogen debranching enzyme